MINSDRIVMIYGQLSQLISSSNISNIRTLLKHQKRNPHIKIDFLLYLCKIKGEKNVKIKVQMAIAISAWEIIIFESYQDKRQTESQGFYQ